MLCLGAALTANAQTPSQRAKMKEHTDSAALKAISKEAHAKFEANYKLALELAEQNGWPLRMEDKEVGSVAVLTGVRDNGMPVYKETSNLGSAETSRVLDIRSDGVLGYALDGQDMLMGMWEIGAPRKTHSELTGRITTLDDSSFTGHDDENFHATHVAGTMIGSGSLDDNAIGIAWQAELLAANSFNDLGEAADAADPDEYGLLVSNHSYGLKWVFAEAWEPGAYTQEAREWDALHFAAPYYQAVMAAGNDRTGNEKDELLQEKTAKNVIVVAAVEGLNGNYTGPNSVQMSTFSTWGPTDDRRIKPDISAKGVAVWSCSSESNSAHDFAQGTSMASPGVAGVLILLQQHYMDLHDMPMRAATLKALMTHTADEAGAADGPDFKFGWGLINATEAVLLMDAAKAVSPTAAVKEEVLSIFEEYTYDVEVTGNSRLKATIAWTDPAGPANNGTANSTLKRLVNDLDLRIYKMNGDVEGEEFFPWVLANPVTDPAEKADNPYDNIEVVEILEPEPGTYRIKVTHKDELDDFEDQRFSLIVDKFVQTAGTTDSELATMLSVYPNPAKDVINISLDSSVDTSDCAITIYDIQGRQVKQFSKYVETINVSDLSAGVYMLNIATDGAKTTRKVVVE